MAPRVPWTRPPRASATSSRKSNRVPAQISRIGLVFGRNPLTSPPFLSSLPSIRDLVQAVIAGDVARVRALQAAGVPIDEPDQSGWLPIHRAAANDRDDIIRLLVQWGSPLEARGADQWTPLHLASVSRSSRAVSALLEAGANLQARSVRDQTPLHLAVGPTVIRELLETVRVLVEAGADPNAADNEGRTPLEAAREVGHPELQSLLESKAV